MHRPFKTLFSLLFFSLMLIQVAYSQPGKEGTVKVKKTGDFTINGKGTSSNWSKADWLNLAPLGENPEKLSTKAKVLYSDTGMYFLFQNEDRQLSATMDSDFMELWREDVVEVFLWPDEDIPFYFEYELSPLNYELLLLVLNKNGYTTRWQPFDYDVDWQTRHMTSVKGGKKESNSAISEWTAEFFIPYNYLHPLQNVPPRPGSRWRANFYRVDYDDGPASFAWQSVDGSFHQYDKFGVLVFE